MPARRIFIFLAWLGLAGPAVRAQQLSFDDDGLKIGAGSIGEFTLEYPVLHTASDKEYKIVQRLSAGATATVTYQGGAVLSAKVVSGREVQYAYTHLPADATRIRSSMLISFAYQQGGAWSMDSGAAQAFPIEQPAQPHLFANHATKFVLTNYERKSLAITFPDYTWLELNDNRAWNWPTYALNFDFELNPTNPIYAIHLGVSAATGSPKSVALVDALGQGKAGDWPGKMKRVDELKADLAADDAYYNSFSTPRLDPYGGLPNSEGKFGFKDTGYFHVEKMGAKWALVDPEGNLFFHLGVCAMSPSDDFTLIAGRESAFDWIPPKDGVFKDAWRHEEGDRSASFYVANYIRKYDAYDLDAFQERMVDRIRKFGFNSLGAFSQVSGAAVRHQNISYVEHLPLESWEAGIRPIPGIRETWDPYDSETIAKLEAAFSRLADHATQTDLIGYYLVNEPAYEDVPKVVPGLKGSEHACKRALVDLLRSKYPTIDAFNAAWGVSAKSFDELSGEPLAATTPAAAEDVRAFTGQFFETYFKLISDTFHQYDTHHMLIGCRLQPVTINDEQLCRIAGKYLDVMSFNYYTDAVDKDFLNRIYSWTGRPILLSEFDWCSSPESGLAGGRNVATQRERGLAYRNYVEQTAALGYIVGIEWFTLIDQADTGRWFEGMSGERANTGLFSVVDRPWKDALEEMKKTNDSIYDVELGRRAPFVFDNPRFEMKSTP